MPADTADVRRSNSFKSDAGNPNPDDAIDYDRELITVGWVDILLGFAGADSFSTAEIKI